MDINEDKKFWYSIKHFDKTEFECRCGCGFNAIDKDLVKSLDNARDDACCQFIINSACRCIKHNKNVVGEVDSSHIKGLAVDINIINDRDRFKVLVSLIENGFNRIGVYKNFIHVDIDTSKTKNIIWYK